jgi:hypothetical protein
MADELVKIKIVFDAKTKDLVKARLELMALDRAAKKIGKNSAGPMMASAAFNVKSASLKMKKSFDMIDAGVKMVGKGMTKFLGMAIKGVIVEMGLLGASMLATHALFASGRFLMKAYGGAMQLIAGGAAALTMALGAAAAAMREQQAAMYAYRGKGAQQFGSAMNQTRMAMRNLQADADLAILGVDGLNKAYGVMSKTMSSTQINASNKTLKALMDFGSAGQDPQKAIEQVAAVVAALNDQKKSLADVKAEAAKLGPEMQKALKESKFTQTKAGFKDALFSGLFAEKGGVAGQFDAINNTLIGRLKSYMTQLKTEFADFGDQFLEPTKGAFEGVFKIIRRDLQRISATIGQSMGFESITNGFVSAVDGVSNWMVKTIREYLPKAVGMFDRLGDWMTDFKQGWKRVTEYMRPLELGAKVLEKAFKPVAKALQGGASNLWLFNDLLQKNEGEVLAFGEALGGMITKGSELFMNLKKGFFDLLPFLTKIMTMISQIFGMMTKMLTGGMGKGLMSALAPLLAFSLAGRAMGKVTGRFTPESKAIQSTQQMNVTAGNVTVTGGPTGAGGTRGPVGPGGTGAVAGRGGPSLASGAGFIPMSGAHTPTRFANLEERGLRGQRNLAFMDHRGYMGPNNPAALTSMDYDMRRASFSKGQEGKDAYDMKATSAFRGGAGMKLDATTDFNQRSARQFGTAMFMDGAAGKFYTERHDQRIQNEKDRAYNRALAKEKSDAAAAIIPKGSPGSGTSAMRRARAARLADAEGASFRDVRGSALKDFGQATKDRVTSRALKMYGGGAGMMANMMGGAYDANMQVPMMTLDADGNRVPMLDDSGKPMMSSGGSIDVDNKRERIKGDYKHRTTSLAEGGAGRTGFLGKNMARLSMARDLNRVNRNDTKFGAASNKFGKSMGGKMGASMGLGIASQYAPEEMQGAMALGGMVSQFDARAGLAVAGLGGAWNAKSAGAGAMAGAAGGAALGSYLGPYGALAGAVIGGLAGAFKGMINKGKEEAKKAKEAMKNNMAEVFSSVVKQGAGKFFRSQDNLKALQESGYDTSTMKDRGSFEGVGAAYLSKAANIKAMVTGKVKTGGTVGDIASNKALLEQVLNNQEKMGVVTTEKERKDMFKSDDAVQSALNAAGTVSLGETSAYQMQDRVITNRLDQFVKMSGKSIPELEKMAHELGFNLYDTTIKFTDALKGMGMAAGKSADQMKQAFTDIFLAGSNLFTKARTQQEAQKTINQSSQGFRDQMLSGGLGVEEKTQATNDYFESYFTQSLAASGNDPIEAYLSTQNLFGQGEEGGAFAKGATFEGMGKDVLSNEILKKQMATMSKEVLGTATTQVSGLLTEAGFAGDAGQIKERLTTMSKEDPTKFADFLRKMQAGELDFSATGNQDKGNALNFALNKAGLGGLTTTAVEDLTGDGGAKDLDEVANRMTDASDEFKAGVKQFTDATKGFFTGKSDKPEWWDQKPDWYKETDTSTPRGDTTSSRLSQTMARHGEMNSQLTGKRTITSAWRNTALGSINSDHVTGKAYDLTGQNLGQYQRLVHANGGFAEFHGTLADRHLHVVPGSGYGDTAVPSMSRGSSGGSGGSSNSNTMTVSISVNGGNGSPEQVANMVMMKLKDEQRKMQERS